MNSDGDRPVEWGTLSWRRVLLTVSVIVAVCVLPFVVMAGKSRYQSLEEEQLRIVDALALGWWRYPAKVLPEVSWSVSLILQSVVSAALAFIALHAFCSWIAGNSRRRWRRKWTAGLMALMFLGCGFCVIAAGLVSHSKWLSGYKLDKVWVRDSFHSLGQLLDRWSSERKGAYPASLEELKYYGDFLFENWGGRLMAPGYVPGHSPESPDGVLLLYSTEPGEKLKGYLKGGEFVTFTPEGLQKALFHSIAEARRVAVESKP